MCNTTRGLSKHLDSKDCPTVLLPADDKDNHLLRNNLLSCAERTWQAGLSASFSQTFTSGRHGGFESENVKIQSAHSTAFVTVWMSKDGKQISASEVGATLERKYLSEFWIHIRFTHARDDTNSSFNPVAS